MSDRQLDARIAQVAAVRELLAGLSDDDTVRVGDVLHALETPDGEWFVDMLSGPRERLEMVRGVIERVKSRECRPTQALATIEGLVAPRCTDFPLGDTAGQTTPIEGDRVT